MEEVKFVESVSCRECIESFNKAKSVGFRAALIQDREKRRPCRGCVMLKDQRAILQRMKG